MASKILPVKDYIDLILNGDACDKPCDSCSIDDIHLEVPPWFDETKFKRGQAYIRRNMLGQSMGTLVGLICTMAIPSFLTIVITSQKSSTVLGAYRRYTSTILHMNTWYKDTLKPGSESWKSLLLVRIRHLRASKSSTLQHKGHISQRDLALAQFGFSGIALLHLDRLGMGRDPKDIEAFIHFWRTIGFMLGIEDRYNVCRESIDETIEVASTFHLVFLQILSSPPEYFYHMFLTMLKSFSLIAPGMNELSHLFFVYRMIGMPGYYYHESEKMEYQSIKLDGERFKETRLLKEVEEHQPKAKKNLLTRDELYDKFTLKHKILLFITVFIHETLHKITLFKWYVRFNLIISQFILKYFPYSVAFKFGWTEALVDPYKSDKSYPTTLMSNAEVLESL